MIRATQHSTKFCNTTKLSNLDLFISEYRRISNIILNKIWSEGYCWTTSKDNVTTQHEFNVNKNLLEHPKFIDYTRYTIETKLSARVLSSLVTQLAGIIGASVEKQRKRLYMKEKLAKENKIDHRLEAKIRQNIPVVPNLNNLNPELSSKCADFESGKRDFFGFLRLKCLGICPHIIIPLKHTTPSRKHSNLGVMKTSFLVCSNNINIRWEIPKPTLRTSGSIIGADQGFKTCLTMSDRQITPKQPTPNPNKFHDLETILTKMSRQRKGSKAFRKSQVHRKNYIYWALKQLNLDGVKEIRLEEIWNIGYKSSGSRILSHWTNTEIRDCLKNLCEEAGVRFTQTPSTYKSQRCSKCGMVRKSNRKGKVYKCKCGCELDADYNSSLNQVLDLPPIMFEFRKLGLNKKGFYWLESGLFDLNGEEIRVPLDPTINK